MMMMILKGRLMMENRVWRSTLILSFASCYIMWGMPSLSLSPFALSPSLPVPKKKKMMRMDADRMRMGWDIWDGMG